MELLDHNAQDGKVHDAVKQGPSCTTPGSGRTVDSLPKTCSGADEPRRKNGNGTETGDPTFGMSSLPKFKLSNWIGDPDRKGGNGGNGGATSGMSLPKTGDPTFGMSSLPKFKLSNWIDEPDRKGGNGGNGGATSGMSLPNFRHLNNDDPTRKDDHMGGNGGSGGGRSLPNILNVVLRVRTDMTLAILGWNMI